MEEDLRELSLFEMQERIWTDDRKIAEQERIIESLRSELLAAQESLAKLEAKKEAEPIPTFEVGKCYRNRKGEIVGPLEECDDDTYPLENSCRSYTRRGTYWESGLKSQDDLLPGAVDPPPTWTPPASLPDGEYFLGSRTMANSKGRQCYYDGSIAVLLGRDFTKPATLGRWQVKDGKATYLGEA